MKGFPVKTVMSLDMGGESCTTGTGQPIAMDDVWNQAADASMNAATASAAGQAGGAVGNATADAVGNSVGGSIAGSAVGAASREVMSGMLNKFRKKKKKAEPVAETVPTASGFVTLFKIDTEMTSIDEKDVSDKLFEVPAGWKKVSNSSW